MKATESLEAHFDVSKEIVETEEVSDNIMEAIREERSILRNERTTHLDMWVSYLAFIFDLNLLPTLDIFRSMIISIIILTA